MKTAPSLRNLRQSFNDRAELALLGAKVGDKVVAARKVGAAAVVSPRRAGRRFRALFAIISARLGSLSLTLSGSRLASLGLY